MRKKKPSYSSIHLFYTAEKQKLFIQQFNCTNLKNIIGICSSDYTLRKVQKVISRASTRNISLDFPHIIDISSINLVTFNEIDGFYLITANTLKDHTKALNLSVSKNTFLRDWNIINYPLSANSYMIRHNLYLDSPARYYIIDRFYEFDYCYHLLDINNIVGLVPISELDAIISDDARIGNKYYRLVRVTKDVAFVIDANSTKDSRHLFMNTNEFMDHWELKEKKEFDEWSKTYIRKENK